ncbi:MAG: light-harvesting antenna LH1, beta subunit [Novosphingobium sp.]
MRCSAPLRHDRRAPPYPQRGQPDAPQCGHHNSSGFDRGDTTGERRSLLALHVNTGDGAMSNPTTGDDRLGVQTYLTPEEAKEFHKLWTAGFVAFVGTAVVAHVLVWMWAPWL